MGETCPICLEDMTAGDLAYPTLCGCGYNFCSGCIEHMIETSKSPNAVSSDGSMTVKLRLQCPQCRGELHSTVHDTLVLRKRETFKRLLNVNDSELTASELRQKHSIGKDQIAKTLKQAEERYTKFFLVRKASSDSEEGVEVEDEQLEEPEPSEEKKCSDEESEPIIDSSLFTGLQYFMSKEEQVYVTSLMTSGEVQKLAQAAQILNGISQMSRKGIARTSTTSSSSRDPTDIANLVRYQNAGSTHSHTHRTSTFSRSSRNARSAASVGRAMAMAQTDKERKERQMLQKIAEFQRKYPLPVRMPNYIVLEHSMFRNVSPYHKQFPLQFVDDEWDGTIADAFAKVQVGRNAVVRKLKSTNDEGVANVLGGSTGSSRNIDDDDDYFAEPQTRVIISYVKGEAGKQGAQSGDVITHLNGEPFYGNSEKLMNEIENYFQREDSSDLTFVLNAEASTAEALKLRAMVLSTVSSESF